MALPCKTCPIALPLLDKDAPSKSGRDTESAAHLDGTVAGVDEVVGALGWREEVEELAEPSPGGFDVTGLSLSDEVFELGEHLFDRIEVGAVGRQEDEVSAFGSDDGASGLAFMAAEVVQDDDIARREDRGEKFLLDVKEEGFAVDRPIDHPRRINPSVAQRGDEGQGLPIGDGARDCQIVCGAIVTPMEGAYGNQERDPGRFAGGA